MCLGVPGQIVAIEDVARRIASIDVGGVRRSAGLQLIAGIDEPLEPLIGTWVLIHVGYAMAKIDEEEAKRTLALLREMGEIMEAEPIGAPGRRHP